MRSVRASAFIPLATIWFGLSATSALAEYQDPFHCRPPLGQQMTDLAASVATQKYMRERTAANKQAMCGRYRWATNEYAKAVEYCRRSSCNEPDFQEICSKRRAKAAEWRQKFRATCGRG